MDMSLTDPRSTGGGHMDLGEVLIVVSPGGAPFWVNDVDGDPLYGKYSGGFPPPGGAMDQGSTYP